MTPRIEIGIDSVDPESLSLFWASALGYEVGDFDSEGIYLDLRPPLASLPPVYLQRVPEAKTCKNRVHLDLFVADIEVEVGRLTTLGARPIGAPTTGEAGGWWQVMADPEGNEFCVCAETVLGQPDDSVAPGEPTGV